jgi:hypothetical protein
MLTTPLDPYYNTTIHTRPLRFAYFIGETDSTGFERVASVASTQWGGLHNLIIPIRPAADPPIHNYYRSLMSPFEPDRIVAYCSDHGADDFRSFVRGLLTELFPRRAASVLAGDVFDTQDHSLHALAVIPSSTKRGQVLQCPQIPAWSTLVNCALFGRIYPGQENDYRSELTLSQTEHNLASDSAWNSQFQTAWNSSPINLTTLHLSPLVVSDGVESNQFEIILGDSVNALCLFWNSRALAEITRFSDTGRRTLLCPINSLDDKSSVDALIRFCRRHLAILGVNTQVDLLFHAWTDEDFARASASLSQIPSLVKRTGQPFTISHRFAQDLQLEDFSAKPLVYAFVGATVPGSFRAGAGRGTTTPTVWREETITPVRRDPVDGLAAQAGDVALDLECGLLDRFPASPAVATAIRPDAWFSRWGLTAIIGGLSNGSGYDDYRVPREWDALTWWFSDRGYSIGSGQAGRYGETMIASIDGIENVRAFATSQAYRVLQKLALKNSKKVARHILKLIAERAPSEAELLASFRELGISDDLKGIPRSLRQLQADSELGPRDTLAQTVDSLVRLGAIRRGLYLECSNCGAADWYALRVLDEKVECSGCRYAFYIPAVHKDGSELQFQFRLNTLINRAVDQDVLPSVLTLFHLSRDQRAACRCLGVELSRNEVIEHEFDVLFVARGAVYGAECKASGALGDKDFETARFAAQQGFARFWFATTAASWALDTSEQVAKLRSELSTGQSPMQVSTLTATDVFGPPLPSGHL